MTPVAPGAMELEREELEWLLSSGVLGRSQNVARMLRYLCEEHFEGRAERIKEYTIAVEALGRRADFDSQADTIVRVTAHSLRKRLSDLYEKEGAHRPVRIVIPPGHYAPLFIHTRPEAPSGDAELAGSAGPAPAKTSAAPTAEEPGSRSRLWPGMTSGWLIASLLLILLFAGVFLAVQFRRVVSRPSAVRSAGAMALPAPNDTIHALMGASRKPYLDRSGVRWTTGNYCTGGANVRMPEQKIGGTEDPYLYLAGTRGIAHCIFPVKPGLYELHLHFAETSDLQAATRVATISVNAGPNTMLDVVDDAGGNGIATSRVFTGVSPENDGAIHLDYISEVSPLNAVEILPTSSDRLLPVRIVAAASSFVDSSGQRWMSDRYFSGGRRGQLPEHQQVANLGIYGSDRVGHFRYTIPVVPFQHYRVRLFFREPWFGKENGGSGGPGSRVFDVSCNGSIWLKSFDILAAGGSGLVVKTYDDVQATASGKIELSFTPVVNYPIVNAIEVIPAS